MTRFPSSSPLLRTLRLFRLCFNDSRHFWRVHSRPKLIGVRRRWWWCIDHNRRALLHTSLSIICFPHLSRCINYALRSRIGSFITVLRLLVQITILLLHLFCHFDHLPEISSEDLNSFFGGPAFLAWARMGNLHGWGGPLSQNWLDQQLVLQKQIITRMLELGMTPVLPSFSGNVPAALTKIFPSAKITRLGDWNTVDSDPRWCCTYLLDPSDPLFVEIGEAFIKKQIKEYGDVTDIYNWAGSSTPIHHFGSHLK